jgi:TolB-like protein
MLVSFSEHVDTQTDRAVGTRLAKRRAKVRSAWISFAGRIVAQILGAAATVGFALIVLGRNVPASDGNDVAFAGTPVAIGLSGPVAGRPTVAVLPFHTFAATPDHDHMAGALTDLLVSELAQQNEISVTSATSSMRFQGGLATVPEIGRQLGVTHIVEGSITVASGRARVIAQLIDAGSDRHVWARSYETTLDDALAVESRVAKEIAGEVRGLLIAGPR